MGDIAFRLQHRDPAFKSGSGRGGGGVTGDECLKKHLNICKCETTVFYETSKQFGVLFLTPDVFEEK